jgi:Cu-Zn family superoxide dismutase
MRRTLRQTALLGAAVPVVAVALAAGLAPVVTTAGTARAAQPAQAAGAPADAAPAPAVAPPTPPGPTDRMITAMGPTFVHNPAFRTVRTTVLAISVAGRTFVLLAVAGLPQASWGKVIGAHVHVGRCGRDPNAAGAHYVNPAAPPTAAPKDREIWLDFKVQRGGWGLATTTAKYFIKPGAANSVVIHAAPTDRLGNAGARLTCSNVPFGHDRRPR